MTNQKERLFIRYPKASVFLFLIFFLCLSVFGLEFLYRIIQRLRNDVPILYNGLPHHRNHSAYTVIQPDSELGWMIMPNVRMSQIIQDLEGNSYSLNFSTDAHGFRLRDTYPGGILFVGDSFTQAVDASDEYTYYAIVKQLLPQWPISGIGVAGFGTLQEFMLVDRVFSVVKPSVIVLQMCDNDLIDNTFELVSRARLHPLYLRRPYYENGQVTYREQYGLRLATNSRIFWKIYNLWLDHSYLKLGSFVVDKDDNFSQLCDQTVATTRKILEKGRENRPSVKFFAFSVGDRIKCPLHDKPPPSELLERAATSAGYIWLGNLTVEVDRILGKKAMAGDGGHYNQLGNTLIGKLLAERLEQHLGSPEKHQ